ncbi:hypothetical protein AGABI2DRAFT_201858 [Agaricus bisporus var. bisporus H97]|uniref:hypothetical protein n=1 Tax=Agaricus bisporus var. bisporus (strain H97 / ATCC MYA-4626 / FGSC 10389) TaxID=936046 RepID=UPI00029F7456|nr:hypothetical protein AGABI2DRAFT_201858 [Agaricus bisporus var. bisporus H97]EKV49446.1 hypothetical protein AGABI2DRAFT_201858 [Agaricus bisporus var. bisporus H97]
MKRRSSAAHTEDEREELRQQYRKQLDTALVKERDPLGVYHQFVQWTIKSYGETDKSSGLIQLLEEATRKFKDDPLYKADQRYLELWTLYAKHSGRHSALSVYKYLMINEIGISYSLLYEEYANALELEGRKQDADTIYRRGIKKQVRPVELLKEKYKEFLARVGPISSATSSSKATSKPPSSKEHTDGTQRKTSSKKEASNAPSGTSKSSPSSSANIFSTTSTAASRYAVMMAPPPPGKRLEKLMFDLSLLFSDGQEYSIQEARARSMGLLGKKWGPPPASEMPLSAAPVDFNDDGSKKMKHPNRKKSLMGGAEPTVTINTKEALADVFGMYNSPEKTKIFPGSKHAPVKKVEPVTPIVPPLLTRAREDENINAKTPSTFRPFVDENAQPNRTTPGTKFTPFVDSSTQKTPVITPRPALGPKSVAIPVAQNEDASRLKSKPAVANDKPVFSEVFAPTAKFAPQRNTSGETRKKDGVDSRAFTPFVDESAKTPFKVFSRPGEDDGGAAATHVQNDLAPKTPNAAFTPFVDKTPAFTPFRDSQEAVAAPLTDKTPSGPKSRSALSAISISKVEEVSQEPVVHEQEVAEEYEDEYREQEQLEAQFEVPADEGEYEDDEDQYYREAPLGGRFGQFNVMTPITERTCEYTMGTTPKEPQYESAEEDSSGSPRSGVVFIPPQIGEDEALKKAERLAAELREGSDVEYEEEEDDAGDEPEEEYVQVQELQENDYLVDGLEEGVTPLSLAEKRSPDQEFQFSNPVNPFEPAILSLLLSQLPSDEQFFDLHDQTSRQSEALEKSTRKSAPLSPYMLTLDGHRFMVSEKLGEGGFGTVFKARDMGERTPMEDDDDYDDLDIDLDADLDDDESSSLVAIKIVKPRNIWEYHVLRCLHASLPDSLRRSLVLPHALYAYSDESFLILDLCPQGMLLNVINNAVPAGVSQQGACLDELLVMFFSVELIRLVEGIHNAGFIHGDLKIDNCLLRLEDIPGGPSAWNAQYQPSGEDGWSYKGLKVIDFGRTIDTRMFPSGQEYLTDWATDERDCFELRQGRPWTFQTDYFGLAGIIYCMLFGKYIQESSIAVVSESETKRYKIGTPLKRYWQGDIWNRLFDVLLNPCLVHPDGALPISEELASIRKDMEVWLQANCNRSSNTLKGLLKKVEKSCYTT